MKRPQGGLTQFPGWAPCSSLWAYGWGIVLGYMNVPFSFLVGHSNIIPAITLQLRDAWIFNRCKIIFVLPTSLPGFVTMATVLNFPLHFPYFAQPSSGPGLEPLIGPKPHSGQSSRPAKTFTKQISSLLQFPPFPLTEDTAAFEICCTQ